MELILDSRFDTKIKPRLKINWTTGMIEKLRAEFPIRFNKELAADLGISWRTLVRKARELGIEKQQSFLDINRQTISKMAIASKPANKNKGVKGFIIPNSEQYQFKKGHESCMNTPDIKRKANDKRNETIRKDRLRIKYGLPQLSKLKLTSI